MNIAANRAESHPFSASGPASLEDPLYYLHNFQWVLDWVETRYADLLSTPERVFPANFRQLPQSSRALLVRMIMRKGQIFRADKLLYPEIGPTDQAALALVDAGWLDTEVLLTLEELFEHFTWPELRRLLADTLRGQGLSARATKREALARLTEQEWAPRTAAEWGADRVCFYRLTIMPLADRFRWLFFGNPYQDWSEFVLTELGLFQYEPVVFDDQSRPVHSAEELQAYWQLQECREWLHQKIPLAVVAEHIPALASDNSFLVRTRERLFFKLGREWERAGELKQALWAYTGCHYPGARGRLLRVLERLEQYREALTLARVAAKQPETEAEVQQLGRLLPRLHRKLALEKPAPVRPVTPPRLDLSLPVSAPVELSVLEQLRETAAPVYYVENTLVTGLFGLLFWDAIFTPLTGAFFHPFQRGPADLYWPNFYTRRKTMFDQGFTHLAQGRHGNVILETFREKWGRQSPFVHWGVLDESLLADALACIPAEHLKLCFERLLRDIKANRAGLPDLIQFWPDEGRYLMIEVKGPGDRLQDNQKRWLEFFAHHKLPVTVCYVTWDPLVDGADE